MRGSQKGTARVTGDSMAYGPELARLYDVVDSSEGRVRVIPVELPTRDAPLGRYEAPFVGGFNELEAPIDAYYELEI